MVQFVDYFILNSQGHLRYSLTHIFCRKYVPCLAKFPKAYIFEPWLAPRGVQHKCGCIIGKDYPKPIVDHDVAKQRNIERMKKARKAKYGGESSDEKGTIRDT